MADGPDTAPPHAPDGAAGPDEAADALRDDRADNRADNRADDPAENRADDRRGEDTTEADDAAYADLRRAYVQRVVNNFHGTVQADGAAFGFGEPGAAPGLAPGTVEPADIDRALRHWTSPGECYDLALDELRDTHLLVLTGEDGSGRRTGALALLRAVLGDRATVRSQSPANSLHELTRRSDVQPGTGYAIFDYVGEQQVSAVQEFAVKRLRDELRRKGSYLVITASESVRRRIALQDFCRGWTAPDPTALFARCAGPLERYGVAEEQAAELTRRVAELRRPRDVAGMAARLRESVSAALESKRDSERKRVRDWFDTKPEPTDLLPIAALAFTDTLPERVFERHFVTLTAHERNWERQAEDPTAEPLPPTPATAIEQSRTRWKERGGLAGVERRAVPGHDDGRTERCVCFVSEGVRELVVAELDVRHGAELWYPLQRWLGDLSLEKDLRVRQQVARGVALHAADALGEVEEQLLNPWAAGVINQRVTAALALDFMAQDERLAPEALRIAIGWTARSGTNKALTAAMALGGELGRLYRLEALRWLWVLACRGEHVAASARRYLVFLYAAAEHQPELALTVLRYVRTRLSLTRHSPDQCKALAVAAQVLGAQRLDASGSMAAHLLRTEPWAPLQLASLWVSTLFSNHRRTVLLSLCHTLSALRDVPGAAAPVRELGERMRQDMTERQWAGVRHDLSAALRMPDFAPFDVRQLVHALLGSLGPATGGPSTAITWRNRT